MASLWEAFYGRKPRLLLSVVMGMALTVALAWADFSIRGINFSTGYVLPLVLFARVRRPQFLAWATVLLLLLCCAGYLFAAQSRHELITPTAGRYRMINRALSASALLAAWGTIAIWSRWQLKGQRLASGSVASFIRLGRVHSRGWLVVCLVLTASIAVADMISPANLNPAKLYVLPILLCIWTQRRPETIWALLLLAFVATRLGYEIGPGFTEASAVPSLLANRLLDRLVLLSVVLFVENWIRPWRSPTGGLMGYEAGGAGNWHELQGSLQDKATYAAAPGRRRKIAYIGHTAALGGGEIALLNLLRHLDRRQYDPLVILGSEGPLVNELTRAGVETHVLPLATEVVDTRKGTLNASALFRFGPVVSSVKYVARLSSFIRRRNVSLIHTNSLKADILGGLAGRLASKPVLWHVRDRIADDYIPKPAAQVFRAACCLLADYVATNSDATLALLRPTYGDTFGEAAAHNRMRVIHDGVTQDAFVPPTHGFGDRPRAGLVGRISPFKGQDVFIRAAAIVHRRFPAARFEIIGAALFGEQAYEQEVRGLVESLGLKEVVVFSGFRADVTRAISDLDILVHASVTGEPFGQVIVEGMAASKPVIATNGGGVPEIVVDGVTGLLVPMGKPEPMADAICHLLANSALAVAMGQAGLERARRHFSIENTASKVEAFYRKIFQERENHLRRSRWATRADRQFPAVLMCLWLMIALEFLSAVIEFAVKL